MALIIEYIRDVLNDILGNHLLGVMLVDVSGIESDRQIHCLSSIDFCS